MSKFLVAILIMSMSVAASARGIEGAVVLSSGESNTLKLTIWDDAATALYRILTPSALNSIIGNQINEARSSNSIYCLKAGNDTACNLIVGPKEGIINKYSPADKDLYSAVRLFETSNSKIMAVVDGDVAKRLYDLLPLVSNVQNSAGEIHSSGAISCLCKTTDFYIMKRVRYSCSFVVDRDGIVGG
jgi:hypothetical protein